MRRIRLTAAKQEQREQTFKTTAARRLRERCPAVLMASRGRTHKPIAQDLGGHRTPVRRWLEQDEAQGLDGRVIPWAPGQPARSPSPLAPPSVSGGQDGPQRCGVARAHWTYEELATHLYRVAGMAMKRTAMPNFCRRQGIRPYRPTYRSRRGHPEAPQAAQEARNACKKKRKRARVSS